MTLIERLMSRSLARRMTVGAIILLSVAAIYRPAGGYDLLLYDDDEYITKNVHVMSGVSPANVLWAFNCGYAANWHPATWVSHMTDVSLAKAFGESTADALPTVAHWHNILLHALNALLLWLVMLAVCRVSGRNALLSDAWLAGLAIFWAWHPLRVEVVCWASERKELLCTMWMLVALMFWASVDANRAKQHVLRLLMVVLAFGLALMSKGVAVTFPALLLAWKLTGTGKAETLVRQPFDRQSRLDYAAIGIACALSLLCAYFTMISQTEALDYGKNVPTVSKLSTVVCAPIVYLRQTLWPNDLSLLYPQTVQINWPVFGLGILLIVSMFAIVATWTFDAVCRWRNRPGRLPDGLSRALDLSVFAIAWCYVGLVPMLGIVKVGSLEHSDRYTYWISCGACVVLCLAVASAPSRKIVERAKRSLQESLQCTQEQIERYRRFFFRGLLSAFVIAAVALFLSTRHYMVYWSDTITLFERSLPRFWNVNFAEVLNQELKKANRETEREQLLSEAVIKCPSVDLLLDYAYMLIKKAAEGDSSGRPLYTLARVYAEQALQIDPKSDRAIKFMEAFNKGRKAK